MDNRVLKPVVRPFEEVWPTYSYAPLTRLVLTIAERWRTRRMQRLADIREAEPSITISRQLAP